MSDGRRAAMLSARKSRELSCARTNNLQGSLRTIVREEPGIRTIVKRA